MDSYYIIVYINKRTELTVAEICYSLSYEVEDYDRASRQEFTDYDEAVKYCQKLAKENGLLVNIRTKNNFLD